MAVVITSLPWLEAMAETTYTEITSREDVDVALRMGVIADSQYTAGAGTTKLNVALQTFNTIDPNYDGLAMVGDIVYQSSSTEVKTDVYDLLDTSLSTYVKNGEEAKPYIFAMGNHEFPLNVSYSSNPTLVQSAKETYKAKYCAGSTYDSAANEGPYINQVFGKTDSNTGYHFITAAPIDYSNQLSTTSETWILEQVDAAIGEDSNKPVFVLLHQPIQNTAYDSSTVRYSENFKSELQQRPQVVVLSGHTHYATNDPRMIWQDGFSLVMIGCTGGGMSARQTGYAEGNEATLLEVDDNNVVSFYRIDVNTQKYIGEPWVLDIPAMVEDAADGTYDTNTWKYTNARKEQSATPAFPETAKISVTALDSSSFTVKFPQLSNHETDNDTIVAYRIQVINGKTQSQVQNYSVTSDYYTGTKVEMLSETISALASDTEYTINIYAVSAWGKESAPLTRTVYTKQGSISSDTETDTRETLKQLVSETGNNNKVNTKWDTNSYQLAESGQYITFSFDVQTAGKYELLPKMHSSCSSDASFTIKIDNAINDTFILPKTSWKTRSAGFCFLEGGTHTITFSLNAQAHTVSMESLSIAKEEEASVTTVNAADKDSVVPGGYSDYTATASAGYMAFWNSQTITFNDVSVPTKGTYDVYIDAGSVGTTNSCDISIGGKSLSGTLQKTGTVEKFARNKIGSLALNAGKQTLTVKFNYASGNGSIRRVLLVKEGIAYAITQQAYEGGQQTDHANGGQYPQGWGVDFWNGYVTFTVTPEYTGVYDLSWKYASGGCIGSTYINGELIDSRNYQGGTPSTTDRVFQSIGDVILEAGKTYTVKIADNASDNALNIERLVLTYVRDISDVDPYKINIPATSFNESNLTGDSKAEGSSVVIANDASYVQYNIDVPAGNYAFSIRYSRNANSKLGLIVNGEAIGNYALSPVSSYTTKTLGIVSLNEGVNSIRIKRSSNYFYFTYIQLEKIETPVSELYNGEYIIIGENMAQEFTGVAGDLIARTYLPASLKGQYIQLVAGVYDGDTLVESVYSKPITPDVDSVVVMRFEDITLDEAKTYTWKVQDYVQYTLEHAGISDGTSAVSGTLCDGADTAIAGTAYDKVIFASKLIFNNEKATMSYADNIHIELNAEGNLAVTGLGDSEVVIEPEQFGFTSFQGQVFELQITTDATDDTATVGLWINKQLANNTTYTVSVSTMTSDVAFDDGITHYSLWRIAQPDSAGVSFVQMLKGTPYIVTDDTFVDASSKSYEIGSKITVAGEYTATTGVQTLHLVLWKKYDLHADGACDTRDLVAMKKVESEAQIMPETKAGKMAASELDSAYELVTMRQELVGIED